MTDDSFSIKDIFSIILFVFIVQITSLLLTNNFLELYESLPSYQPAGNTVSGSILNSIILILPTFFITSIILFLLRRKLFLLLKSFLMLAVSVGTFSISYIILTVSLNSLFSNIFILIFSLFLCIIPLLSFTLIKSNKFQLLSSYVLSSLYGTMLAVFIKPPTLIIIPIAFAFYDIYAVFRGPLKSIIDSSDDSIDLRPLFINLGRFNIGTGDLIFYSMIPSSVFLLIGLPFALLSIFFIHMGMILTIYLLKHFEMFPGLPIPVFLSLIPYLLFY